MGVARLQPSDLEVKPRLETRGPDDVCLRVKEHFLQHRNMRRRSSFPGLRPRFCPLASGKVFEEAFFEGVVARNLYLGGTIQSTEKFGNGSFECGKKIASFKMVANVIKQYFFVRNLNFNVILMSSFNLEKEFFFSIVLDKLLLRFLY